MSRTVLIERNQRPRPNRELATDEVVWFKAEQKYVTARSLTSEITLKDTIKSLAAEFPERFFQTHIAHLVQLDRIVKIIGKPHYRMFVQVRGVSELVPLGRRVRPRLLQVRPDLAR